MTLRDQTGINAGDPARPRPLEGLIVPPAWTEDALCAQVDQDVFFPDKGGDTRAAKNICDQCPVTTECLTYALDNNEPHGIWGGLPPRERRRITKGGTAA